MKNIYMLHVYQTNNIIKTEENIMYSKHIYDIIIENTIKDWKISMNKQIPNVQWEVPKHSKSEINKAGNTIISVNSSSLREINITLGDIEDANNILNNWRASHAYPLHVICSNLRLRNPNAIVVQRLKRLDSIINKLERNPKMNLYRMQDLGGCRVIVNTIDEVYEAIDKYKNSRIRHILKREYDYIQNPKESGYRSYHMVYQFHSDKKETYNKNMLIEIQFRTKLQHIWATAVEMMGIYTKSNLKSSQGDKDILRFFTLVSSVFALQENMSVCPNTSDWMDELIKEIMYLDNKHHIISTLSSLNVAINHTDNIKTKSKNTYYVIILDYAEKEVTIKDFKSSNIEIATQVYGQIENNANTDVVLVSANSFEALREAYPNYFVDISRFVNMIKSIIRNYEHIIDTYN